MSGLQLVKKDDKYYSKLPIKPITLSSMTSNFTNFNGNAYRIGDIGIINFSGSFKELTNWKEYEICTMNVKALHEAFGVLSCQNAKYPINLRTHPNSNKLYVHPFGNFLNNEDWFRGQLIFIITN